MSLSKFLLKMILQMNFAILIEENKTQPTYSKRIYHDFLKNILAVVTSLFIGGMVNISIIFLA